MKPTVISQVVVATIDGFAKRVPHVFLHRAVARLCCQSPARCTWWVFVRLQVSMRPSLLGWRPSLVGWALPLFVQHSWKERLTHSQDSGAAPHAPVPVPNVSPLPRAIGAQRTPISDWLLMASRSAQVLNSLSDHLPPGGGLVGCVDVIRRVYVVRCVGPFHRF